MTHLNKKIRSTLSFVLVVIILFSNFLSSSQITLGNDDVNQLEIHVAVIENGEIIVKDEYQNNTINHMVISDNETVFKDSISPDDLFTGDENTYAFASILQGNDDGKTINIVNTNVYSVYNKNDDIALNNENNEEIGFLGNDNIYYLYYPIPKIKYVKKNTDNELTDIKGSLNGNSESDKITNERETFEVNGKDLETFHSVVIPEEGFHFYDENDYVPQILDDGIYPYYLKQCLIGVGTDNTIDIDNLTDYDNELFVRFINGIPKWSFDEENWSFFDDNPIIYIIYEEKGYDIEIKKTMPYIIEEDKTFDIEISSEVLKKESYSVTGLETNTIEPEYKEGKGKISFHIVPNHSVKISGLEKGEYQIFEKDNNNYLLSANDNSEEENPEISVNDNQLKVNLNKNKKIELTNTAKYICKITTDEEIRFHTLNEALEYIVSNLSSSETIEMLDDYVIPSSDLLTIPADYNITFTTARDGIYQYDGEGENGAVITKSQNIIDDSLFTNYGSLIFDGITLDGNNILSETPLISNYNTLEIKENSKFKNAKNSENGGVLASENGVIRISDSYFENNEASNGAVIYSENDTVIISSSSFKNNKSVNGGVLYYDGTNSININNGIFSDNQTSQNGGVFYATAGSITVSGNASFQKNKANENGGVIYMDAGSVNIEDGKLGLSGKANTAKKGSAIFVNTGQASFSGGNISNNHSLEGGAVQVGANSARLYFSGNIKISNNYFNNDEANVYLNFNTDNIINAQVLDNNAYIGIYAHGNMEEELFKSRGEPGTKFASYTEETNFTAFHNDRLSNLKAIPESQSKKIMWGKSIHIEIRYLPEYHSNAMPPLTTGTVVYDSSEYYPTNNEMYTSEIADALYPSFSTSVDNALYGGAYHNKETLFSNSVTKVKWSNTEKKWVLYKGSDVNRNLLDDEKLIIYYTNPSYVSIENNTNTMLNISNFKIAGNDIVNNSFAYVFAKNGAIQNQLVPVTASDLVLSGNKSVKLLIPGFPDNTYQLTACYPDLTEPVSFTRTGNSEESITNNQPVTLTGNLLSTVGSTYEFIFGGAKAICKIVNDTEIPNVTDEEIAQDAVNDDNSHEYLFRTLNQALNFIKNHQLHDSVIEMLVDYQLPQNDVVTLPSGYDITFTTAVTGKNRYDADYESEDFDVTAVRSTISRDADNHTSFISTASGNGESIYINNLIFDGKNFSGNINGGVINTVDCNVEINNTDFKNCKAKNGGGIFIDFNPLGSGGTLTLNNSNFLYCESKDATNRKGGGGIWTTAKTLTLNNCSFEYCNAGDQGGAVFHRIDTYPGTIYTPTAYATESKTFITNCKFSHCSAKAAGGVESDAHYVKLDGTEGYFKDCTATSRGGGGLNTYIYDVTDNSSNLPDTTLIVDHYIFERCVANTSTDRARGGGIRSVAKNTTISNCQIKNCSAYAYGGGISITNTKSKNATISNCTISGCSSNVGGGIYMNGSSEEDAHLIVENNCNIFGNFANNYGAGIYTSSKMTLRNNCNIIKNQLNNVAVNGAGVYMNNKQLILGTKDSTDNDTSSIKDNTIKNGSKSNLRLWEGSGVNNVASIYVWSPLTGNIGVVNAKSLGKQFGSSYQEMPTGFSDNAHVFISDNSSIWGAIDRTDSSKKKIIWSGPPVCKITDKNGELLYLDNHGNYAAVFDTLDSRTGANGSWVSAFGLLRNPTLYYKNGDSYPKDNPDYPYYVKMLVHTYEAKDYITSTSNANRTIYLTTAETEKEKVDEYYYKGNKGTYCTIKKLSSIKSNNLFTARNNLHFENIIIDGGYVSSMESPLISTVDGAILDVREPANITVTIGKNTTIQNSNTTGNGTIIVKKGNLVIDGGTITNCISSKNGGTVYMNSTGNLTIEKGSITNCNAQNGGAVYVNNGKMIMNAGRISNCSAQSGGAVFLANNKRLDIKNVNIFNNQARTKGGAIAIGGDGSRIYFYESPKIYDNKSENSKSRNKLCNVEIDASDNAFNNIIHSGGLGNNAKIGVYIPEDESPGDNPDLKNTTLFDKHGLRGKPFGTFETGTDTTTLYGFINDRNQLKGGKLDWQTSSDHKIYWIEIFSLEISKKVESFDSTDKNIDYSFILTLSGTGSDGTNARDITTSENNQNQYGELIFKNGVSKFTLKHGESITAEKLPYGLNYTIKEDTSKLSSSIRKNITVFPNDTQEGMVGENVQNDDGDRYISKIEFINLHPTCKIVNNNSKLLYYQKNGHMIPAVYIKLNDAFEDINNRQFYQLQNDEYTEYERSDFQVHLLVTELAISKKITIQQNKKVTLTTASKTITKFPYQGIGTAATVKRSYNGNSMFIVGGDLTCSSVILDGNRKKYTADSNGGIVDVLSTGNLTLKRDSKLYNSLTSGYGGGVYVTKGGSIHLLDNPSFGGTGLTNNKIQTSIGNFRDEQLINKTNGKLDYTMPRQDIYLADTDNPLFSLVIDGYLNVDNGSIWVWAENDNHGKAERQFAVFKDEELRNSLSVSQLDRTLKAFRNARDDTSSSNVTNGYLTGAVDLEENKNTYIYWYGLSGSSHVIFSKIGIDDNKRDSLNNVTFTIYKDSTSTTIATGSVINNETMEKEDVELKDLVSGKSGIFFIGDLPYGTYYLKETANSNDKYSNSVNKQFEFIINENGIVKATNQNNMETFVKIEELKSITHD